MEVSYFGGVNEIGGNKILLTDKKADARVFLDFGKDFAVSSRYFANLLQPRSSNGIVDYLETGILPKLQGLYRHDLLEMADMERHQEPTVDAVILSHAHLDHCGHISFLDERIPIYCSGTTLAILKAVQETEPMKLEKGVVRFKRRPDSKKSEPIERTFVCVDRSKRINGLEIGMLPVDHSVPGAMATIIYGSDMTLAYSGDLRTHGTDGHLTEEFVDKLAEVKPDVFLCEGTHVDSTDKGTEDRVKEVSSRIVSKSEGLVIADFSFKDTTRFKTFFEVAKANGRKLAIEFRDAYYIRELAKQVPGLPDLRDDGLLLYERKKGSGDHIESDYKKWEREFLDYGNTVEAEDVVAHQKETIITLGYFNIAELIDLKPAPKSVYLKSASEAFNEEQEFDEKRLMAWLERFGLAYEHSHASGHAPRDDLKRIMDRSNAKKIVPIHTEHPELFRGLTDRPIEFPKLSV